MRIFLGLLVVVAVAGGVLTHRKSEPPATASGPSPKVINASPAPPREVSQHNWAKRSLDRATDVKRQVDQREKEDGTK